MDILKEILEVEMHVHLGYFKGKEPLANSDNARNGYIFKILCSELEPVEGRKIVMERD